MSAAEERTGGRSRADEPPIDAPSRYEPLDVPPLLPFWLGFILAAFVGIVLVGITIGYPLATHQEYRGPLKELPPAPRLETAPVRDFQAYEAGKATELRGSKGPSITAAMRATAKRGWGPPK